MPIYLKSKREIEMMRKAGQIVAQALQLLAEHVKPGVTTGELDALAYKFITGQGAIPTFKGYHPFKDASGEGGNYGIVRQYGGHGIGRSLWEDPSVPNWGVPGKGIKFKAGMVIAIEPMLNLGTDDTETLPDGWTVVTADRKPSAHF